MDVKFIFDRAEADKMRRDWERVDRSRTKASEIIIIKKEWNTRLSILVDSSFSAPVGAL